MSLPKCRVRSAEIRVERRFDVAPVADLGEHVVQQFGTAVELVRARLVEIVEPLKAVELARENLLIVRQIHLAGVHAVFHVAHLLS